MQPSKEMPRPLHVKTFKGTHAHTKKLANVKIKLYRIHLNWMPEVPSIRNFCTNAAGGKIMHYDA